MLLSLMQLYVVVHSCVCYADVDAVEDDEECYCGRADVIMEILYRLRHAGVGRGCMVS